MDILQTLFSSPKMQDIAFGTIRNYMRENDIQYLLVELRPDGELDLKSYAASDQPVVMPGANMAKLEEMMTEQEQTIKNQISHINLLEEKVTEQFEHINLLEDKQFELENHATNNKPGDTAADQPI